MQRCTHNFFFLLSGSAQAGKLGDQKKDPLLVDSGKGMYKPFEKDQDDHPEQAGGCSSMVKSCSVM